MNTISKQLSAQTRQREFESTVFDQARNLLALVSKLSINEIGERNSICSKTDNRKLLLLAPLIEIAWANGSMSTDEQMAILSIAEEFGLKDQRSFWPLKNWLELEPAPEFFDLAWKQIEQLRTRLSNEEDAQFGFYLLNLVQFVAQQNDQPFLGFWRQPEVQAAEQSAMIEIYQRLRKLIAPPKASFKFEVVTL